MTLINVLETTAPIVLVYVAYWLLNANGSGLVRRAAVGKYPFRVSLTLSLHRIAVPTYHS